MTKEQINALSGLDLDTAILQTFFGAKQVVWSDFHGMLAKFGDSDGWDSITSPSVDYLLAFEVVRKVTKDGRLVFNLGKDGGSMYFADFIGQNLFAECYFYDDASPIIAIYKAALLAHYRINESFEGKEEEEEENNGT